MTEMVGAADVVTLWRPTGQSELDLVAASGWTAWPPRLPEQPIFYPVLNQWYARKIAREWNVAAGGVGYVTGFDVRRAFLDTYDVHQVGGRDVLEYWIPADDLIDLNANIVGVISEVCDYRAPVDDGDFDAAEAVLGARLPEAWRAYLQGESWLRWWRLPGGDELLLYPPLEGLREQSASSGRWASHPGIATIGCVARRGRLVVDLRRSSSPVLIVKDASAGWDDAVVQADSVGAFVAAVDDCTLALAD